ncbi:MAG: BatD family protein [Chlamydiales bacterium]|nr:BatD family protein [Chlamydiales bacterium]
MVIARAITIAFVLLFPCFVQCEVSRVAANVEVARVQEPIIITISVQHSEDAVIDDDSFEMDGKKINVELMKQITIPSNKQKVSIYTFTIPPEPRGLHILPAITFTADGKMHKIAASSYAVGNGAASEPAPSKPTASEGAALGLEALFEGPSPMYPGQTARFIYRYSFNANIELKEEHLPLFDTPAFKKIGAKQITDRKGKLSIREVAQEVEALEPGTFHLGPSFIKGFAYKRSSSGQKKYVHEEIKAEAPIVTVEVKAFPEEGKPPSFNGAIGEGFIFDAALIGSDTMRVGDKITLLLEISGSKNLEIVPPPELCCQPGFSGRFRFSDLPPVPGMRGPVKTYTVELRPLTASINEIPPIEFSFFNPKTEKYHVLKSEAIPIKVKPLEKTDTDSYIVPLDEKEDARVVWPQASPKPRAIEIEGNYRLVVGDLKNHYFGTWTAFLLIPFGIVVIALQMHYQTLMQRRSALAKTERSDDLLNEAIEHRDDEAQFYRLLTRAFLLRLKESGYISSTIVSPQDLSDEGVIGEARRFLVGIEEKRFAAKGALDDSVIKEARALFKTIKKTEQ